MITYNTYDITELKLKTELPVYNLKLFQRKNRAQSRGISLAYLWPEFCWVSEIDGKSLLCQVTIKILDHDSNLERMLNKDNVHFIDLLTKSKWFNIWLIFF